jgi:hypothetical protein
MALPTVTLTCVLTVEGTLDAVASAFSATELQKITDYIVQSYRNQHPQSIGQDPLAGTAGVVDTDTDATTVTATRATIA